MIPKKIMERFKVSQRHKVVAWFIVFVIIGMGVNLSVHYSDWVYASEIDNVVHFGKSKKYNKSGVSVIVLKGEPFDIGYARGILLKEEIFDWLETTVNENKKNKPEKYKESIDIVKQFIAPYVPQDFREELEGLSAALKIDYYTLLIANSFAPISHNIECTSIVIKDSGGTLLRSRNLDWIGRISRPAALYFIHPTQGHAFVSISHCPGFIGIRTAFNEKGLSIGGHNMAGASAERMPEFLLRRQAVQYAASVDEVSVILEKTKLRSPKIWIVSDTKNAKVFEFDQKEIGSYQMEEDHLVVTNFTKIIITNQSFTSFRDKRILEAKSFLLNHRGRMDLEKLIEVNRIDSLTGYKSTNGYNNIHSAIFNPDTLDFWVAVNPPYSTRGKWVGFNLKKELYGLGNTPKPSIINAMENL